MRIKAFLLLSLAAACQPALRSDGEAGVGLRVEPDAVAAGDTVTLVLRNDTAAAIGYNLCSSGLQRRVVGEWQPVTEDRVCTMELRTLDPGGEARYPVAVPADAAAGEYRYVTTVERMDSGARGPVTSGTFRIAS